jgi:hypothetical protein
MKVERHTSNGRFYGCFYTLDNGVQLYLAHRKRREVFQARSSWCLDLSTLNEVKRRGISIIGIVCKSGKDKFFWVCDVADFFGIHSFAHMGDTRQRGLPLSCFKLTPGLIEKHIAKSIKLR